jgi:rhodanese-related sulfurtransferase
MTEKINRIEVQTLAKNGAQLVEVLGRKEYAWAHLPQAINIPLWEIDSQTTSELIKNRPIVVYCHDYQWDLSPRAASRLETLGFEMVFDYVAGKLDWLANDLPVEGELAAIPKLGDLADRNIPTCFPEENVSEVRDRMQKDGRDICVVVDKERVVLGIVKNEAARNPEQSIDQIMEPGPSTFRPHVAVDELANRIAGKKIGTVLVTTSDGRLLGSLREQDVRSRREQRE